MTDFVTNDRAPNRRFKEEGHAEHRQSPHQPYFKALHMAAADLTKPQARVALRYTHLAKRREPWNPGYAQILSTLYHKHPSLTREDV